MLVLWYINIVQSRDTKHFFIDTIVFAIKKYLFIFINVFML